jgi:hypothetical protein
VGPVVVALLELRPGLLEHLLPELVAEEGPERGRADLHAVVVVGPVGRRDDEELVAEILELRVQGLQGLEPPLVVPGARRREDP